ncbi:flagellin N-terminal helical domain-containing protein [Mitsuokella sp. oral taxon 131]|uniref:flagellin N-terminal helical domain-containing protein n=1 Tax=Mitsuokella sp. oral taxon 131 TaxID=1321780 RepID=UPI0004026AC3|nr:flagellin [Mitsuokella sp. oral taxon 131]
MAMIIKNNMPAKNTLNQLDKNDKALAKSLKKVASGMKINSAADDASGYAISEKMRVQIQGLDQDYDNTQTGASLLKVASGGLQSSVDVLRTLKQKAIDAANDTNTDADRATIQKEIDQAIDQLDENAEVTYNGKTLIDGSHNNEVYQPGTRTTFTNESLDPATSSLDAITDLKDFAGRSLGIMSDSKIEISTVYQGRTVTRTLDPVGTEVLADMINHARPVPATPPAMVSIIGGNDYIGLDRVNNEVRTASGNVAMNITAADAGVDHQLSGVTFKVVNSNGTLNRTANDVLNNFSETIRAQDPSPDNAFVFHIGTKANQSLKIGFEDMRSYALGLRTAAGKTISVLTQQDASAAINVFDNALAKVLNQQTEVGSVLSRMDYTGDNITTASENTQASESVIRDADMAKEMTAYTKNNVLKQASQSMLAQANQNSSSVLSLLQ